MDCSPPGSSVHGILQARILEWIATPSSRESFGPGIEFVSLTFLHVQAVLYHWCHLGSPSGWNRQSGVTEDLGPVFPVRMGSHA